jgi:hypothetical protein
MTTACFISEYGSSEVVKHKTKTQQLTTARDTDALSDISVSTFKREIYTAES